MSKLRLRLLNCVVTLSGDRKAMIDDVYEIVVREDYYRFSVLAKPQEKVKVEDVVYISIIPKEMEHARRRTYVVD